MADLASTKIFGDLEVKGNTNLKNRLETSSDIRFTGVGVGSGLLFNSTVIANDAAGIRQMGTNNNGELEFFTTDDDVEPFVFRHYTSGQNGSGSSVEWFKINHSNAYYRGNKIWHAGNDGSGSGLDADTVDGLQASSFIRSDADDTVSGKITFSQGDTVVIGGSGTIAGSNWNNGCFHIGNATLGWAMDNNELYNSGAGIIGNLSGDFSINAAATLKATGANFTFNGGKVWTAGNDGSGSGLDADTVDGKQGSMIIDTYRGGKNTDDFGTYILAKDDSGWTGGAKMPGAKNAYGVISMHLHTGSYYGQLHFSQATEDLGVRFGGSTWGAINKIYHTGNDGAGSGLDADTLDGKQLSTIEAGYQTADANLQAQMDGKLDASGGTVNGQVTVKTTGRNALIIQTTANAQDRGIAFRNSGGAYVGFIAAVENGTDNADLVFGVDPANNAQVETIPERLRITKGGLVKVAGNTVWHAGNDGAGSGMDADLLDGYHASDFPRKAENAVVSGMWTFSKELVFNASGQNFKLKTDNQNRNTFEWVQSGVRRFTLDVTANGDLNLVPSGGKIFQFNGGAIWHAGNDGAGSGLDADTLDGQHGSYYQPTSTAVQKDSSTGAAKLPVGTTSQRPSSPVAGMFRYNSQTSSFEGYSPSGWSGIGGASGGAGNPFVYEHDKTVTQDYTIAGTKNAISAGPLTVADGVTVTVADGATWTIVGG